MERIKSFSQTLKIGTFLFFEPLVMMDDKKMTE